MLAVARSVTPPGMSIEWYETSAEAIPLPDEAFDTFVDLVFSLHDTGDLQHLINDAGFREAAIHSDTKTLRLPTPEEFLWQCVQSTPTGECGGAGG